jgi:hypothetical protein
MACFSILREDQTLAERQEETSKALKRLEMSLMTGKVTITIGPNGAISFANWRDRDDLSDVCAYRVLQAQGSHALKVAVQAAERKSGRKVNAGTIAAGYHTHNAGRTWTKH